MREHCELMLASGSDYGIKCHTQNCVKAQLIRLLTWPGYYGTLINTHCLLSRLDENGSHVVQAYTDPLSHVSEAGLSETFAGGNCDPAASPRGSEEATL